MGPLPQIFTLNEFSFKILLQKLHFCIKLAGKAFQISSSDIPRKENVDKKVFETWKRHLYQSIKETQKYKSCYGDCSEYWDKKEKGKPGVKMQEWGGRGIMQTIQLCTNDENIINIELNPNHNRYRNNSLEKDSLTEHLPAHHYAPFTKQD